MVKYFFIGLLTLTLAGCALGAGYQAATASWVGASIEEVLAAWGPPSATEPLRAGERSYIWDEYLTDSIPTVTYDETFGATYEYNTLLCRREIIADALGRVRSAWNSYDCWQVDSLPEARVVSETGLGE